MLKEENIDEIINSNKRISLIELEDMIQNGITPPNIKEIDDMPKEEWVSEETLNENNKIENQSQKRKTKPWEKLESNNIINIDNL